jgi:hypothetical protein
MKSLKDRIDALVSMTRAALRDEYLRMRPGSPEVDAMTVDQMRSDLLAAAVDEELGTRRPARVVGRPARVAFDAVPVPAEWSWSKVQGDGVRVHAPAVDRHDRLFERVNAAAAVVFGGRARCAGSDYIEFDAEVDEVATFMYSLARCMS